MQRKPDEIVITPDHYASVFINTDGQCLVLSRHRGGPPFLVEADGQPIEVDDVQKLHGSATTWVASGLILANDEGIWLKTSLLAADRWLREAA